MKSIYLLLISMFIVFQVFSQRTGEEVKPSSNKILTHDIFDSEVILGPEIGLNISNRVGIPGSTSLSGLNIGAVVDVNNDIIGHHLELQYSEKGFNYTGYLADNIYGKSVNAFVNQSNLFNYIEFEYMLKCNIGTGRVQGFFGIGTFASFLLNQSIMNNLTGISETDKVFYLDHLLDLGYAFGGGVKVFFGPGAFVGEFKYEAGLKLASDGPNRTYMISLGYLFNLSGEK
jgi:hypothetical protein